MGIIREDSYIHCLTKNEIFDVNLGSLQIDIYKVF